MTGRVFWFTVVSDIQWRLGRQLSTRHQTPLLTNCCYSNLTTPEHQPAYKDITKRTIWHPTIRIIPSAGCRSRPLPLPRLSSTPPRIYVFSLSQSPFHFSITLWMRFSYLFVMFHNSARTSTALIRIIHITYYAIIRNYYYFWKHIGIKSIVTIVMAFLIGIITSTTCDHKIDFVGWLVRWDDYRPSKNQTSTQRVVTLLIGSQHSHNNRRQLFEVCNNATTA